MNPEAVGLAGPPSLRALPAIGGTKPVPTSYEDGRRLFDRAGEVVDEGNWTNAADMYLEAALRFRSPEGPMHARGLASLREAAYRNAWACFKAADQQALGRARLVAALEADPALASRVDVIVGRPQAQGRPKATR